MTTFDEVEFSIGTPDGLVAAGAPVEPPPLVPSVVNLVRSSRNPTDAAGIRWEQGFSYLPLSSGELGLLAPCSPDSLDVGVRRETNPDWEPYLLTAAFQCSTLGSNMDDYRQRAMGLLDAATPKLIEYEFWNGLLAQAASMPNLYLLQSSGIDVYTATSICNAIGICEAYLSAVNYGGRGMIHLSPFLAPYLYQAGVRREGNLLLTNRDTIVVPGSGYGLYPEMSTVAPPLPTSGPYHIYATGITDVRMSPIYPVPDQGSEYQGFDRATNTIRIGAQRLACASWDGAAFARVDLTMTL
jgi:hypothetical protein